MQGTLSGLLALSTVLAIAAPRADASVSVAVPATDQGGVVMRRIAESRQVVIAVRDDAFPFAFGLLNQPAGFAVELCAAVVASLRASMQLPQLATKYVRATAENRVDLVASGQADMECGMTTHTNERTRRVTFSLAYFYALPRMLVPVNSGLADWPDLRDRAVAVIDGATVSALLAERDRVGSLRLVVRKAAGYPDALALLQQKKVAAVAADDIALHGLRAQLPDPDAYRIAGTPLSTEAYALMLPLGDRLFVERVNQELARMMGSGEFVRLYRKWFETPLPQRAGINLKLPMSPLLHDTIRFPIAVIAPAATDAGRTLPEDRQKSR